MARTALMDLVLRSMRTVTRAQTRGVPAEQLLEEQAISRRNVLAAGAGAAVLSACAGRQVRPSSGPDSSVAIVGAGVAGLHCAHRLRKLGVEAQVFEASTRLGGRMYSDRSVFPDGMHCELGGELIDTRHQTMLDLAKELDIELLDYRHDDQTLAQLVAHIGGRRLSEAEILTGFGPIATAIEAGLKQLKDPEGGVSYRSPNGGEALDKLSIHGWLNEQKIDPKDPVRQLIEIAYSAELGLSTEVTSALSLLLSISTDRAHFEVFGDSDERFHTRTGNDTFIQMLAKALGPGQVSAQSRLLALAQVSDGRYLLTFDQGGKPVEVKADHVVLALPFTMLREVDVKVELPALKKTAIAELGYGTNAKLMTGYTSRPWRGGPASNATTVSDLGYQLSWETSRLQEGKSGIITNFCGDDIGVKLGEGTPEERAAEFVARFEKVFPGVAAAFNGKVARMHWPSYPFTKASYAAYKVGQYSGLGGAEIERVANVHFCGEHTSLDAQGFMEGGAITGAMAAREIAGDLGIKLTASIGPEARIWRRAETSARYGRWIDAIRPGRRAAG